MKCSTCGAPLNNNSKCEYCGVENTITSVVNQTSSELVQTVVTNQPVQPVIEQPITSNQPVGQVQYNNQTPYTYAPVPKQRKNNAAVVVIVIILILIIGIGTLGIVGYNFISEAIEEVDEEYKESNKKDDKDDEEEEPEEPEISDNRTKANRTMMVYIIGSDLESKGGAASTDIQEMLDAKFDSDDLNLLVYAGGTKRWQNSEFDEDENAIYQIADGEIKKVKSYSKKLMTNKSTLTEFINYVYANYESEEYSLVLWDHGGGPVFGYGLDENNTKQMLSIKAIDEAINDTTLVKKQKFEFIGFDACLMSSIEIANAFKEEANYLIASTENEPGDGWDYNFLSEITSTSTTEQIGRKIVDYYFNFYQKQSANSIYGYSYSPDITLSLLNLSKIENLNTKIDDLFEDLDENINIDTYSKISRETARAKLYGYDASSDYTLDLVDLYDLTSELEDYRTKATSVQSAISSLVTYHRTNMTDCHGLSMYFPNHTKKVYNIVADEYGYDELIVSENYRSFLKKYTKISTGDRLVKSEISTVTPTVSGNQISTTIPADVAANYETADYIIFRKIKDDGSFLPVYKSSNDGVVISGNKISAKLSNQRIAVGNAEGKEVEDVIAYEYSRDANSITYSLVTVLQYWDDKDFIESFVTEAVTIYLKVDNKTKQGTIVDIKRINAKDDNVLGKKTYNLNDWKYMQFLTSSYMLQDKNGNKLDEWQKTDTMYGTEVNIAEGYKFFQTSLDKNEEYYYMFRVKDTQGNVYETNLVKAK